MYASHDDAARRRATAAIATLAIHGAIGVGLIWGLASDDQAAPARPTDMPIVEFSVRPPPPPPPPPSRSERKAAKAHAAREGIKGTALPKEAPTAAVPLAVAPAAPIAGEGREANAGAGAQGSGPGAGGAGTGTGGGGDGGVGSPARRIAGALRDSDYPREAEAARLSGTVVIGFRVRTDGRVDRCTIVRSSDEALLDQLTCRLFTDRYRFRPATTASGQAVESTLQTSFTWGTRRRR